MKHKQNSGTVKSDRLILLYDDANMQVVVRDGVLWFELPISRMTPPQPSPKRGGSRILLTSLRFGGIEGGHSGGFGTQGSVLPDLALRQKQFQRERWESFA